MHWGKGICLFGLSFGVVLCAASFANADESVSFVSNPVWLSTMRTTEGESVRVSTVITKKGTDAISGEVTFYADAKKIGAADFSLPSQTMGAVASISFTPSVGTHRISAKITRARVSGSGAERDLNILGEVKAEESLAVDPDNDRDKISDANDTDDDGDGVSDGDEKKKGTNPLVNEIVTQSATSSALPHVAGTATTSVNSLVDQATDVAKSTGNSVFQATEALRTKGDAYIKNTRSESGSSTASAFVDSAKKGDWKAVFEGAKAQVLNVAAFVFGSMYAFYLFFIVLILWILRKIWKRYSLD